MINRAGERVVGGDGGGKSPRRSPTSGDLSGGRVGREEGGGG